MKPITSFALLCAFAAVAQGAVTDPVGYTTTVIYGASSPTSPKLNVIAPDLQNSAVFVGEVASIAGDVVTLVGASFTAGAYGPVDPQPSFGVAYTHMLETADGYWAQVTANGVDSITVEAGAGSNFVVGETVSLRPHVTIANYFGAGNEAGLLADSGGDVGSADNITVIDETNGGTFTVIASDALGGTWITESFDEGGNIPIYPDQGLQVIRRGLGNLNVVMTGEVDTNTRQVQVSSGLQIRPFVLPIATTLSELNLYTGDPATGVVGSTSGDIGEADVVTILDNGVPKQAFYSEVDLGSGAGWYDDSLGFVGADVLPAGVGLIINRANPTNSDPFTWVVPAPTVAP